MSQLTQKVILVFYQSLDRTPDRITQKCKRTITEIPPASVAILKLFVF
ncbi:MAG: hypothetical protein LBP59_15160 [Planctomycetaceae bacterium]|nr:hypothetical protein [Planctomycetaceae bacterium]